MSQLCLPSNSMGVMGSPRIFSIDLSGTSKDDEMERGWSGVERRERDVDEY